MSRDLLFRCFVSFGLLATCILACSSQKDLGSPERWEMVESAVSKSPSFNVSLPVGVNVAQTAIGANGLLNIDDRAVVQTTSGGFGDVANAGRGVSQIGVSAAVGSVFSVAPLAVNFDATVNGRAESAGKVVLLPRATVTGDVVSNAQLTPLTNVSWTAPTPGTSSGNVTVAIGQQTTLPPGTYQNLTVLSGATVSLETGVYFFSSVNLLPQSVLSFTGPTVVYVTSSLTYLGSINDPRGSASLLVAYSGVLPVFVGSSFVGTLVAPNASIVLSSHKHVGAFFGQNVELSWGATLVHEAFPLPPSSCIGLANGSACPGGNAQTLCEDGLCENVTCGDMNGSSGDTETFSVSDDLGGGLVTYTQTTAGPFAGPSTVTIAITLGSQTLETRTVSGPDSSGSMTETTIFGPAFHGVHEIDAVSDGTTVNETIDGRSIDPIPASALSNPNTANPPAIVFADGNPPPTVTIDDGVLSAIASVSALANASSGVCVPPTVPPGPGDGPFDQPGHLTNVQGLSTCQNCQSHCTNTRAACIFAGAGVCAGAGVALVAVPFVGIVVAGGCEIATDGLCASQANNCQDQCNNIGAGCCPNDCGGSGQCCGQGERCLDTGTHLCCGEGYSPCTGPKESCVDLTQAVCLPSGLACPVNVPTCGTGTDTVCCPSGNCVNGVCDPTLAITVNLQETETGPDICTNGTGFTPGARVTVTYTNIPNTSSFIGGTAIVGANEEFGVVDFSQDSRLMAGCTQAQASSAVTITAVDGDPSLIGSGQSASTTVSAAFWCAGFLSGGGTGQCP